MVVTAVRVRRGATTENAGQIASSTKPTDAAGTWPAFGCGKSETRIVATPPTASAVRAHAPCPANPMADNT